MFTLCKLLTFDVGFGRLFTMKPQTITEVENLPVLISESAWQSIHPYLRSLPNVYVGRSEDCRRFLSAVVWMTKEGHLGVSFRKFTGIGIVSIDVSDAGVMRVSLKNFMNISMPPVNFLRCWLIRRSCVRIHQQRVLRKKIKGE